MISVNDLHSYDAKASDIIMPPTNEKLTHGANNIESNPDHALASAVFRAPFY